MSSPLDRAVRDRIFMRSDMRCAQRGSRSRLGHFPLSCGDLARAEEYEAQEAEKKKAQLSAVVVETMTFLGMAQHTERFLKLLDRSNMQSIYDVEELDQPKCAALQLPFELVSALQRRLKVWKLEMVDDAEVGLDKGEEYWIKKGMDAPMDGIDVQQGQMPAYMMPGMVPMPFEHGEEQSAKLAEIEDWWFWW